MSSLASPPVIRVRTTAFGRVVVRWAAVDLAINYNLYISTFQPPTNLDSEIAEADAQSDGSFVWYSADIYDTPVYVAVTSLDHLGGESALSNIVHANCANHGYSDGPDSKVLQRVKQGVVVEPLRRNGRR